MIEFWVLFGGDENTMATRIVTYASCRETVEKAFPNATRIMEIR